MGRRRTGKPIPDVSLLFLSGLLKHLTVSSKDPNRPRIPTGKRAPLELTQEVSERRGTTDPQPVSRNHIVRTDETDRHVPRTSRIRNRSRGCRREPTIRSRSGEPVLKSGGPVGQKGGNTEYRPGTLGLYVGGESDK